VPSVKVPLPPVYLKAVVRLHHLLYSEIHFEMTKYNHRFADLLLCHLLGIHKTEQFL
jgi:hypothetical protein